MNQQSFQSSLRRLIGLSAAAGVALSMAWPASSQQRPPEVCSQTNCLPPVGKKYGGVARVRDHQRWGSAIFSQPGHEDFSDWRPPPPPIPPPPPPIPPPGVPHTFDSRIRGLLSLDDGATFREVSFPARVTVNVHYLRTEGDVLVYSNEMTQLDINSEGLLIRESPSLSSSGETTVRAIPGGYAISSYFDIYTELSMDGGMTWIESKKLDGTPLAARVVLEDVPGPPLQTYDGAVAPTPNAIYFQPTNWNTTMFGSQVKVRNFTHRRLLNPVQLPALGQDAIYSAQGTMIEAEASVDGGQTFQRFSAEASLEVGIHHIVDAGAAMYFDTEMISLNLSGVGALLRESPTLASEGEHIVRPLPGSQGASSVNSFFNVFLELSLDGGANWIPASGPVRMELQKTLLSVDINDRTETLAGSPFPGFTAFLIESNGGATAIQTAPTVRLIESLTVTLAGVGATTGYDDRQRPAPVNAGSFTQELLLRDFVFSRDLGTGGLDVTIDGLTPDKPYKVTLWSFDNSSLGTRVSDWLANGTLVRGDYTFSGGVAPATDSQYSFSFPATSSGSGQLLIQGRRKPSVNAAGQQDFGVFLNALQVEVGLPDPPTIAAEPQSQAIFEGDHAVFTALPAGTSPISVQWYFGPTPGENPIEDATNTTLVLFAASAGNAGGYSMIANNPYGSATSQVAMLTVSPVASLASGLVGHWPLDTLGFSTPDVTPNMNDLFQANMDAINLEEGRFISALRFNGADEYLARTNDATTGLPLYGSPAYSVAMWVNGVGAGQSDRRVWSESANTNNSPLMTIGTHSAGTDGTVDIFIRGNAGATPVNHRRTSLIAFDGSWHHIAWVDNNGYGRVYVDGVRDTNDFNYVRVPLQGNILSLGAVVRTNVVAQYSGLIDDVHAWRRSLSEAEVRLVMNQIRIASLQISGGNVELTFATANTAAAHRIEEKSDLISGSWSEVPAVQFSAPSGNFITATFPVPVSLRFYRVGF